MPITQITRDQLRAFLPTEALVRAFEMLLRDVQFAPDQIAAAQETADLAQSAAATAQATAVNAGTAAASAQSTANSAQSTANALVVPQYLTLAADGTLTNERVFTVDPLSLKATDNGAGASLVVGTADLSATLGVDVSDATAAFVDATGLSVTLLANATYLVDGLITFQSAATTTGTAIGFTLPATSTISGGYTHNTTASAIEGSYNIASDAVKGNTSGVLVANENVPINGRWVIKTGATAGAAQLRFRTEVAASAVTLKAGLSIIVAKRIA